MDPDEVLKRIRKASALLRADYDACKFGSAADYGADLADSVDALDEWLTSGGFLPAPWRQS